MSVRDGYYVMVTGNRGSNCSVDAEVGCPACHQDATGLRSSQYICEWGPNVRIVQSFFDYEILWVENQFREKVPSPRISLKTVA